MRQIFDWIPAAALSGAMLLTPSIAVPQDNSPTPVDTQSVQHAVDPPAQGAGPSDKQNIEKINDSTDRKTRFRLGVISASSSYNRFSGRPYYSYDPFFYPYDLYPAAFWNGWGPYFGAQYLTYGDGKGQVKLAADPSSASVYIDGAYAGSANRLKSIWLDPGAYDLSLSAKGRNSYQLRIYVLSGKTLRLAAKLAYPKDKP